MTGEDFCITKITPNNHTLHSQWEVGFIFILNPCLMPYIKLWWHSKWRTTRRVGSAGSSETHLIRSRENEMFRGVLTNCCIFCNGMRNHEKLFQRKNTENSTAPLFVRVLKQESKKGVEPYNLRHYRTPLTWFKSAVFGQTDLFTLISCVR